MSAEVLREAAKAATVRAWRAEGERDELLAKYVAVHEAINHVRTLSPAHYPDGEHLLSNSCYRCGVEWLADEVIERMAMAFPPAGPTS